MGGDVRCRLLITECLDGATNMALDEAVLLFGWPTPTLRFYSWSPPCLSIGYSQVVVNDVELEACRRLGIDLVRRPTGGGAILHDAELTYCVVAPEDHPAVSGSILESYRRISRALVAAMRQLGLAPQVAPTPAKNQAATSACFHNPSAHEVMVAGRKLVGSAQCRREGMVLQHGSLLLDLDPIRALQVLKPPQGQDHQAWAETFRKRAICLREALGRCVPFQEAAHAVARGFEDALGLELEAAELSPEEWELARRLRREKYACDGWNMAR